jgi:hypothetical protein
MVYRQLVADAELAKHAAAEAPADSAGAALGGHSGASMTSSAADLHTRSSAPRISHDPDPQQRRYPRHETVRTPTRFRLPSHRDGAPEPPRWSAPPDERP